MFNHNIEETLIYHIESSVTVFFKSLRKINSFENYDGEILIRTSSEFFLSNLKSD